MSRGAGALTGAPGQGTEAINKQKQAARELGLVLDDASARTLKNFEDKIREVATALKVDSPAPSQPRSTGSSSCGMKPELHRRWLGSKTTSPISKGRSKRFRRGRPAREYGISCSGATRNRRKRNSRTCSLRRISYAGRSLRAQKDADALATKNTPAATGVGTHRGNGAVGRRQGASRARASAVGHHGEAPGANDRAKCARRGVCKRRRCCRPNESAATDARRGRGIRQQDDRSAEGRTLSSRAYLG